MRRDGNRLARKLHQHHGAGFGAALERDRAAVVLHNFSDNREPEPGAVRLPGADERIERRRSNRRRDTAAVIRDADLKRLSVVSYVDRNAAVSLVSRLACVQNQIEKYTLKFFWIK